MNSTSLIMKKIIRISGQKSEDLAVNYLKKKGLKILERNFRKKWGEIDIICFDKRTKEIVFVEVKSSNLDSQILPEEKINFFKKEKIKKIILSYLSKIKKPEAKWRFDVISLKVNPFNFSKSIIEYYPNEEIEFS